MDPVTIAYGIGLLIASALITTALTAKQTPQEAPKANVIEDFEFPQFEEGTPQAVCFGDNWFGDWMVIYYGDFRVDEIRTPTQGGKK